MAAFNPNELEIMKALWEHGSLKPSEIQKHLSQPIKNSALRWQLGAMMEKGYVTRRKIGKAFFYSAKTPKQSALKRATDRLADVFCGGSAVALIGQLIESQDNLSEHDINELRRIAAQRTSSEKPPGNEGGRS